MAMKFQYHGWDRQKNVAKLTGQWNPMMIVQPINAVFKCVTMTTVITI